MKLDFPCCDGHNVLDWIFKAEQFFEYYAIDEVDRLSIASVHLENDVVPWFQMMQRSTPFHSWHEFIEALILDFGPTAYECPLASLFKLNQTGTVGEYYKAFIGLVNHVSSINNEALLDCFLSGLQTEIRKDVMALSPPSLVKVVALAKLFKEKYNPPVQPRTMYTYLDLHPVLLTAPHIIPRQIPLLAYLNPPYHLYFLIPTLKLCLKPTNTIK